MKKLIAILIIASTIVCNCFADKKHNSDSQEDTENIELKFPFGYLELPILNTYMSPFDNDYFYRYISEQKRIEEIKKKETDAADLFLFSMNMLYLFSGAPFTNPYKTYYRETPHEKYRREYQELSY